MKNDHGRASGKTRPQEAEERGLCWRACSLELEHSLQIETFAPGKMSRLRAWGGGRGSKQEVMKDHNLEGDKLGRVFKLPTNSVNGSQ